MDPLHVGAWEPIIHYFLDNAAFFQFRQRLVPPNENWNLVPPNENWNGKV